MKKKVELNRTNLLKAMSRDQMRGIMAGYGPEGMYCGQCYSGGVVVGCNTEFYGMCTCPGVAPGTYC
jgi:hypothetical protein